MPKSNSSRTLLPELLRMVASPRAPPRKRGGDPMIDLKSPGMNPVDFKVLPAAKRLYAPLGAGKRGLENVLS